MVFYLLIRIAGIPSVHESVMFHCIKPPYRNKSTSDPTSVTSLTTPATASPFPTLTTPVVPPPKHSDSSDDENMTLLCPLQEFADLDVMMASESSYNSSTSGYSAYCTRYGSSSPAPSIRKPRKLRNT